MTKKQIMRKLHKRKELLQGETTCKRLQYHKKKTTWCYKVKLKCVDDITKIPTVTEKYQQLLSNTNSYRENQQLQEYTVTEKTNSYREN